jgi:hypothetical protein
LENEFSVIPEKEGPPKVGARYACKYCGLEFAKNKTKARNHLAHHKDVSASVVACPNSATVTHNGATETRVIPSYKRRR